MKPPWERGRWARIRPDPRGGGGVAEANISSAGLSAVRKIAVAGLGFEAGFGGFDLEFVEGAGGAIGGRGIAEAVLVAHLIGDFGEDEREGGFAADVEGVSAGGFGEFGEGAEAIADETVAALLLIVDPVDDGIGLQGGLHGFGDALEAAVVFAIGDEDDDFASGEAVEFLGGDEIDGIVEEGAAAGVVLGVADGEGTGTGAFEGFEEFLFGGGEFFPDGDHLGEADEHGLVAGAEHFLEEAGCGGLFFAEDVDDAARDIEEEGDGEGRIDFAGEVGDGLELAILFDFEIALGETFDVGALLIAHGAEDIDEIDIDVDELGGAGWIEDDLRAGGEGEGEEQGSRNPIHLPLKIHRQGKRAGVHWSVPMTWGIPGARALLLLALMAGAGAQDTQRPVLPAPEAQASPPTLRITVTMVQVDAVVTDSKGNHAAGLRAEDFEVLQDGEPRKLTYFSYMPGAPPAMMPVVDAKLKMPVEAPAPVTPGQIRRTVALVVDDLALDFADLVRVRTALREYIEKQMQPGDLAAIVRTGGGVAILEQFTTDRRVLLEAVDLLKWHFNGRSGLIAITPEKLDGVAPARERGTPQVLDYGVSLRALGALGTLEQVIRGMKGLPGRKSIVFLSDGMRVDSTITADLDRVTDLANRSAVSIYAVDPAGLRSRARVQNEDPRVVGADTASLDRFPTIAGADEEMLQEGLDALSARTGGLFYRNRNDIPACIQEAADDQLGYYLLGFSPREGTFDKDDAKARFHKVVVRVKKPGMKVRWKSGFEGVADELVSTELSAAPRTREQQLMDALASPFTATGLKVRLSSFFNHSKQTGPAVQSMLFFDGKGLSFQQDADGSWRAAVDIVTSAYRGVKQPMLQRQRRQDIRLSETQYRQALREGFLFNLVDLMKEPGTFLVRAVVRDAESARIGSASQYVQVPDTRKGQLAMSGIFLRLATESLLGKPGTGATTAEAGTGAEGKAEAWTEGGPATRRYRPGQAVLYGYTVVNPKFTGARKEFGVTQQTRVYRNGKLLFTGAPNRNLDKSARDPNYLVGGGIIRLGGALLPGEYLLQIVVTDEKANKKKSQFAQWIDFEVVP